MPPNPNPPPRPLCHSSIVDIPTENDRGGGETEWAGEGVRVLRPSPSHGGGKHGVGVGEGRKQTCIDALPHVPEFDQPILSTGGEGMGQIRIVIKV